MLRFVRRSAWLLALSLASVSVAGATEYYYVPSIPTPTLQAAVTAAATSALDEHVIFISGTIHVVDEVVINFVGNSGCTRWLQIKPDPTQLRATIISTNPSTPILRFAAASCVTVEDLDILRNITNNDDLVVLDSSTDILIHRCRIGSIWTTPGAAGWSNVKLTYPTRVMLRNNILFAKAAATFDHAINAVGWGDPSNALLLYNNTISDYRLSGVAILGVGLPGQLVLLRNNVVVNFPSVAPEPVAFESSVGAAPLVVSSHNAVFASALGFVESVGGVQSIFGGGATLVLLPRPSIGMAFVNPSWITAPPGDPNVDFFRLVCTGVLHNDPADAGQIVGDGAPAAQDHAVNDDIEREGRPGGPPVLPLHTDRGADQCDPGLATDVETPNTMAFWAAPEHNPARGRVGVLYRSPEAGRLYFEVFDVAGRRMHRAQRDIEAGRAGVFEWSGRTSGVFRYRLRLVRSDGTEAMQRGIVTVIR